MLLWHFRDSGARYKTADLLTYLLKSDLSGQNILWLLRLSTDDDDDDADDVSAGLRYLVVQQELSVGQDLDPTR